MIIRYCAGNKQYNTGAFQVIRAVLPTENITTEQLQEQYTKVVAKELSYENGRVETPFGTPSALAIQDGVVRAKNEQELLEDKKERLYTEVRQTRDRLIAETDYTQLSDTPITNESREAFKIYRQALRDLPNSIDVLDDIVYPTMPAYVKK